ncbi:hypothetical protein EDD86DRAFT_239733, partial [Gorgonomyces haynaldii]
MPVAVVTGGASGFGKALSKRLVDLGYVVVVCDLNDTLGNQVVQELNTKAKRAYYVHCDVTKEEDVKSAFKRALDLGGMDVLVNNAGITENIPYLEDKKQKWKQVVEIDLNAVILGTLLGVDDFKARNKPGVIVNTASIAGFFPAQFQPIYSAAKAGVVQFTRSLSSLQKTHKIRVNCVCPGFVKTPMFLQSIEKIGKHVKIPDSDILDVELVVDAFVRAIQDQSLRGDCLSVLPKRGVEKVNTRKLIDVVSG